MGVLISLAIVTFAFGTFIFLRGEHTMHQVTALIFFMISALFLATALLVKEVRKLIPRRRSSMPAPEEAMTTAEPAANPRQEG